MTTRTTQPIDGDAAVALGITEARRVCCLISTSTQPGDPGVIETLLAIAAAAGYLARTYELAQSQPHAIQPAIRDAHDAGRSFAERAYEEAKRRRNTG